MRTLEVALNVFYLVQAVGVIAAALYGLIVPDRPKPDEGWRIR